MHLAPTQKCQICRHQSCLLFYQINTKSVHRKFTPQCKVGRHLDKSIDRFFTLTFDNYVASWYREINQQDATFLTELKCQLQYSLNCLALRLCHVNLADLILYKFSPSILDLLLLRVQVYNECKTSDGEPKRELVDQKLLGEFFRSGRMHRALQNRSSELAYLRELAQFLLYTSANKEIDWSSPIVVVLREILVSFVLVPVLDLLAEPDTLSFLIRLAFEEPDPLRSPLEPHRDCNLLQEFTRRNGRKSGGDSFLTVNLNDMMNNQPLLYVFINYMKRLNCSIHWLQFLLSLHQLKERMMGMLEPVQKAQMDLIRWEMWELYRNYVHDDSNDRIEELAEDLKVKFKQAAESPDLDLNGVKQTVESTYESLYYMLQERYVSGCFTLSPEYMDYVTGGADDLEEDDLQYDDIQNENLANTSKKTLLMISIIT